MEIFLKHHWDNIDPQEWNSLCARGATNTVFQTYQWHSAWLEEFGNGTTLYLIQIKENGQLIGLAPLMIVLKDKLRILKFIGTGHSDYCDFIYDKENTKILKEIFRYLENKRNDWDAMALDYIPEDSATVGAIDSCCTHAGFLSSLYSKLPCLAFIFDSNKDNVEELIHKKSLQRHYQYFQNKENYQVLHLKNADEIRPFLEQFFEQHIQRCKTTNHQSLFWDERNQRFYKNLVNNLCSNQWLNFTAVQSQGKSIAFHFGLTYDQRFIWYKPSFEVSLSKHSPGEVLLRELLIYAGTQGIKEFDFSMGDEAFKKRFTNYTRFNYSFKVFKSKRDYFAHQGIKLIQALSLR